MTYLHLILVSFFFSTTPLLFTSSRVYFTNYKEFEFLYHDILPYLLTSSLVLFFVVFLFLLTLNKIKNKILFNKALSLVFIFGLLFWIQSNVIVWDYGLFDGKPIQWNLYINRNYIDAIVWISMISISLLKSKWINKISAKMSVFFIILQLIYVVVLWLQVPTSEKVKNYSIYETDKFRFSKDRNVIVLLLDATQTDIFSEVISENQKYQDIFDGFNYFPDTLSTYAATDLSIPSMLSGLEYKNEIKQQIYWENSMGNNLLFNTLKENKYITEIYTDVLPLMYLFSNPSIDNIKEKSNAIVNIYLIENTSHILDISIFNSCFSGLKEIIYNDQKWLFRKALTSFIGSKKQSAHENMVHFFNEFKKRVISDRRHPVFKYYHLSGTHSPYILKSDMSISKPKTDLQSYKEQLRAVLMGTSIFIESLKKINAYDNSFIVITADHGVGLVGELDLLDSVERENEINNIDISTTKMALPLLLIKPLNSRGPLKSVKVQASLSDIPKTIISNIGADSSNFIGIDLLNPSNILKDRSRTHYSFNWNRVDVGNDYPPYLNKYIVKGDSWITESWSPLLVRYYPQGKKELIDGYYDIGNMILFDQNGNINNYKLGGWAKTDPGSKFTWTNKKNASLKLNFRIKDKNDLILTSKALSLFKQKVFIYINNRKVGEWSTSNSFKVYELTIPNEYFKEKENIITFYMPEAVKTPKDLGLGNDTRQLGLAFEYLQLKMK